MPFKPCGIHRLGGRGRFNSKELPAYIIAQVFGAVLAALLIQCIASGMAVYTGGLASNGFGVHSPHAYSMWAGFTIEVTLTAMFLFIIMGATDQRSPAGEAPLAIGFTLALIHMISIPVTNTSVNPALSTGPALIEDGIALHQLWMFWLAPIIGAVIGALVYRFLNTKD